MQRNVVTSLRRSRAHGGMRRFDALPAELRAWLHQAALPWSAHSVLGLWRKALARTGGDRARALAALSRLEARMLRRDAPRVWGAGYPDAAQDGATRVAPSALFGPVQRKRRSADSPVPRSEMNRSVSP